ncbi:MarR family winged helix-turn-helix transcriptional regulator (plasmid) [Rhodobacteraceae bacterium M382]|nr:MarR family winged helix-turn-helix transcriptional regulator [Rhodobacteraceae bacterium M382]
MTKSAAEAIAKGLHIPFQIAQLHSALSTQAKAIISRHGDLNLAQWRIVRLVALDIANTTTAVRKGAGIDKSQFSKMLGVLEDKGYLKLRPFEEDKRQHLIELTEKGRTSHDRLGPVLEARQEHLVSALTADEQATVLKAIKLLSEAAQKTDFPDPYVIPEDE